MFRFIDDTFIIRNLSRDELTEFIDLFNSHDESIKTDSDINGPLVDFWTSQSPKGLDFFNHNILDTKV